MEKIKYSDWRKFSPRLFGLWEGSERVMYRRDSIKKVGTYWSKDDKSICGPL